MIESILAFSVSAQILIAQRRPEHDVVPRLTPDQQEEINLTIANCQKYPEIVDLACHLSYQELVDWVRDRPIIYDRPNLCDKFEQMETPWTQQEHTEYAKLECSIGD